MGGAERLPLFVTLKSVIGKSRDVLIKDRFSFGVFVFFFSLFGFVNELVIKQIKTIIKVKYMGNEMSLLYEAPIVEIIEVEVEKGFAMSYEGNSPVFTPGFQGDNW